MEAAEWAVVEWESNSHHPRSYQWMGWPYDLCYFSRWFCGNFDSSALDVHRCYAYKLASFDLVQILRQRTCNFVEWN